ncbi:metallophosphoesterase family protein [Roseibium limicola]|nr:metallophosphoesterase family protein [Roseibium limicola]
MPMRPDETDGSSSSLRERKSRARLTRPCPANGIYAIGDVHGCLDLLKKLEEKIIADRKDPAEDTLILYLGDLVDRGPDSKGVIDHCLSPLPPGFERMSLCGNHDQLFYEFLLNPSLASDWIAFGGQETLMSYGVDVASLLSRCSGEEGFRSLLGEAIPKSHFRYLQELPVALTTDQAHFVHAGMRPGVSMADQIDDDLMWIREEFLVAHPASDRLIVHGHTPAPTPQLGPDRIGIDTKAVGSGPLTAVHIYHGSHRFLSVSPCEYGP